MDKNYWFKKWELNDVLFHEKTVDPNLIEFINELKLTSGNTIFVPLCGKTKDMIFLANKGFNVVGIEFSPIACKDFFSEVNVTPDVEEKGKFTIYKHKNIKLFCGDFFDLRPNDFSTTHAVYDCKALIALSSELRTRYVNHIIHCVGTHIKILLITRESDCQVNPPPYPVNKSEVTALYSPYFLIRLLKSFNVINIPERLITKGYKAMTESVYLISEK